MSQARAGFFRQVRERAGAGGAGHPPNPLRSYAGGRDESAAGALLAGGTLRALLLAGVTALGLGLYPPLSGASLAAPAAGPSPREAGPTLGRRDALGDPLPAGAVLRLGSVRLRHGGQLFSAVFSPDGKLLASGGWDRPIRLWDPKSGKELRSITGPGKGVHGVAFSPDGKLLAGAGVDGVVYLWDVATGKEARALAGAGGRGSCVAFSPGGKLLAVGGEDGAVRLWDWPAGKEVCKVRRHPDWVRSLSFSPDGKVLASVSDGGMIRLWDTATGRPVGALPGHRERLISLACSRDGRVIATAGWDGTVRLWDARTGKETRRLEVADEKGPVPLIHPAALRGVALSPDGKLVAGVRGDEVALVWDTVTGKGVRRFRASCVAFSPDGKLLACGGRGTAGRRGAPDAGGEGGTGSAEGAVRAGPGVSPGPTRTGFPVLPVRAGHAARPGLGCDCRRESRGGDVFKVHPTRRRELPMKAGLWFGVLALSLGAAVPANAGVIKGIMSVTGAEMK